MLEQILIKMGLNARGFITDLDSVKARVAKFGADLGRSMFGQYLGATGVVNVLRKITDLIGGVIKKADDLRDIAEAFGGDVSFVQRLARDVEDAGLNLDKITSRIADLAKEAEEALGGGERAHKLLSAFSEFGVTVDELRTKKPHEIFARIRENIVALGLEQGRLNRLMDLGFTGRQIPLLTQAESKQAIWGEAQLNKLDEVEKGFKSLWRSFENDAAWAIASVASMLDKITGGITGERGGIAKWIRRLGRAMIVPGWRSGEILTEIMEDEAAAIAEAESAPARGQEEIARRRRAIAEARQIEQAEALSTEQKILDELDAELAIEKAKNAEGAERVRILRDQLELTRKILAEPAVPSGPGVSGTEVVRRRAMIDREKLQHEMREAVKAMTPTEQAAFVAAERERIQAQIKVNQQEAKKLARRPAIEEEYRPTAREVLAETIRRQTEAARGEGRMFIRPGEIEAGMARERQETEDAQRKRLEDIRRENIELTRQLAELSGIQPGKQKFVEVNLDALARLGGFVGGAAMAYNPQLRVAQDQLSVTRELDRKLAQIVTNTRPDTAGVNSWQ